jgi:hypothetical protein
MASPRNWRTLRAFAAVASESSTPDDNSAWVSPGEASGRVEVRVAAGATAANTPTAVVLTYWRRTLNASDVSVVDSVAVLTHPVTVADVNEGSPVVVPDFGGGDLYVTVSFVAGTSPTFTGTVQCRSLAPSA